MKGVIKIWKEKGKILEGIKNNIFKNADVENIAAERMSICETCPYLDKSGSHCMVPGTEPCCGLCGCSLTIKTRALSAACDIHKWMSIVSHQEQIIIDQHLSQENTNETTI
jgi:hypothetical protein